MSRVWTVEKSSNYIRFTMRTYSVIVLVATCGLSLAYDAKFDNVDVDKILGDEKLFNAYVECLLDKGPCEAEYASEYKRILPEVIETGCAKCTPKQAQSLRKSVLAVQERVPDKFIEFEQKYDPTGEHREKFALFLTKTD